MSGSKGFERTARAVAALEAARGPATPAGRAVALELFGEEIATSLALAGSPLSRAEVAALRASGVPTGGHVLDAYVLAADYIAAAAYVRDAPEVGRRHPYLRIEEVSELHAVATRRSTLDRPGTWRTTTLPPFPSGMVAPPAWLVPREMTAFTERLVGGPDPPAAALSWVAAAHARFGRIAPFRTANGRVGRLVTNLLLRRLGYPPLIVAPAQAGRYLAALRRADARDPWPLATLFAESVRRSLLRVKAAEAPGDLLPLAALALPGERTALYKAAERGRLAAIRRGGALLSTQAWVDAYRACMRPMR